MSELESPLPVNPYSPPTAWGDDATDFVKLQFCRLRAREAARLLLPNLPALVWVLAARYLHPTLCTQYGHDPSRWELLDADQLHQVTQGELDSRLRELEQNSFQQVFAYRVPCVGNWDGTVAVLADDGCRRWASCSLLRTGRRSRRCIAIGTFLRDSRMVVTTDAQRGIDPPPHVVTRYRSARPLATLLASHDNWLSGLPKAGLFSWQRHELEGLLRDSKQRALDHYRRRRVWVPMSVQDVARACRGIA